MPPVFTPTGPTGVLESDYTPPAIPPATGILQADFEDQNSGQNIVNLVPFNFANWLERIATQSPSGTDVFTRDQSQAALTGIVSWNDLEALVAGALGFSYIEATTSQATTGAPGTTTPSPIATRWRLRRVTPAQHPRYRAMVCTSVAVQAIIPTGTTFAPYAGYDVAPGPALARYRLANVTLTFGHVKHQVFGDQLMDAFGYPETARYLVVETEPALDVLGSGTDYLKFALGPNGPNPPSKPDATPFQGGPLAYLPKQRLRVQWIDVPYNWVFDGDIPTNIQAGYGKVNETPFAFTPGSTEFPAGTLMLQGATFEKKLLPLVPVTSAKSFSLDITFDILQFDPPQGTTTVAPGTTTTAAPGTTTTVAPWKLRGHNLAPDATKYWWPITSDGTLSGRTLLEPYEFRRLFKHCRDNS